MKQNKFKKPVIFLTGASGSMGYETFKLLWKKRQHYDLVVLARPSRKNKKLFQPYEREAGIKPISGRGTLEGHGLKIVWGDAVQKEDLQEACKGIDWCLCTMGLIPPEADRIPHETHRVNTLAIRNLVKCIEEEGAERIKLVYIGTIAEYGDRLPPIHQGRIGDPLLPSLFDMYAVSKIRGEAAVMESKIHNWVSLRQTFIMIPALFSLMDPIMFHQPINSYMENITSRDAGRVMVKCLEMENRTDFWRRCYNLSGGPRCRTTFYEFLQRVYEMLSINHKKVMERNWFTLKNFHMLFYEDSWELNEFLHHWDDCQSMEDFYDEVLEHLPLPLRLTASANRSVPGFKKLVEKATYVQMKLLASKKNEGPLHWIKSKNKDLIDAFYGSQKAYEEIPSWDKDMPDLSHDCCYTRLEHGYDETKKKPTLTDLREAAEFRGGELLSEDWNGDMFTPLTWRCALDHTFDLKPNTVLKGGHWCLECIGPPWKREKIFEKGRFFAQMNRPLDSKKLQVDK